MNTAVQSRLFQDTFDLDCLVQPFTFQWEQSEDIVLYTDEKNAVAAFKKHSGSGEMA